VTAGIIVAVAALALAIATGLLYRARNGTMRPARPAAGRPAGAAPARPGLTTDDLGAPLGARATLVQFSTAFCAPCRATRQVLADVAAMTDGIAHVEIDAESHLDLVRRLDVRRTPTVLVLGPDGRIARRASGQPRKADVIAALGEVT
jgi:thiol-disulfide isomerase/thioredoxin